MVEIIVEGKTDAEFLKDFINSNFIVARERYDIKVFDGKDNIFKLNHKYYNEIEEMFHIIDSVIIFVDADDPNDPSPIRGYEETESKLNELIGNLDFNIPTDYYIFCDEKKEGYLESFLLSVLDNNQKECIQNFKEWYKYDLTDKWVYNSFYKQKRHPFDYSHPNFDKLKTKLKNLFEGTE